MNRKDYKRIINKRKKIWDTFEWWYRQEPNRLYKNHSIKCGCSMCRSMTYFKRKERRDRRHEFKIELNTIKFDW